MTENLNDNLYYDKSDIKKDIKRTAGRCAMVLFILSVSTYAFGGIIQYILKIRAASLGINIASNVETGTILGVSKEAYNFFMGYLPCILGDILAIGVAYKTMNLKFKKDLFCRNKAPFKFIILGSTSCVAVGMISSIIYVIYSSIIEAQGFTIPSPDFTIPTETKYLVLFILYTCIIAPIFEEVIFRGFILKSMMKYGNLTAAIVSSIMFSMFHLNLVQFINPILMGIIFCFITIKSNSIKSSIIAHMFNNSLIMFTSVLGLLNNPTIEGIYSFIYFSLGFIAFYMFVKTYFRDFLVTLSDNNTELSILKKIGYSFTSPWSIAYIILYIILVGGMMIILNMLK
ncbi:type II CAAX endopeptidase family protein [Clostridium sp. SM-530-WT-3G]|uniref:CPBP family intramembrane glutamic endopeptidase n=1 Tax=Clostridium sp. SM-530-WT-3G TaxID=2725303 RepID=UPI00145DF0A5|nr:type II CAAX endopeptidase family protein [Clostridium sp. SM-530-WT-3G]MDD6402095.1 type II CAAX endopeptidase family protein [Lachnospiraceae bacterium]NME83109.1 CPBP family intramembrane metalloprotease [Clostridium sp. SM-530-WT-3G]